MTFARVLALAIALFGVGIYGLLTRRQAIAMLLSIELLVNASNLVFVAFGRFRGGLGQTFVLFTLTITVAEVAVGLALVLLLYRRFGDTVLDAASEAKG
jgi:NADH-quinone oxidoreductase subunit K